MIGGNKIFSAYLGITVVYDRIIEIEQLVQVIKIQMLVLLKDCI